MQFSIKTQVPPSATVTINGIAQKKKASGERVYNLSAGEPIVEKAYYFKEISKWVLQNNQTNYPPVPGLQPLRDAAAEWMNNMYQTNFNAENILVTCGGKYGIYLALQALLDPNDEVIIMSPYWVSYPGMVELCGGKPVIIQTEENNSWKAKPSDIQQACTPKTKLLIINNAANPTGILYSRQELKELLDVAKKNNLIVISDEVYSGIVYDSTFISAGSFPEYQENTIIIQSCSKNFAMTGWRVGFVFGPTEFIKIITKLQGQTITGTSIVSQWAALEALKNAEQIMKEIQQEMQERRNIFIDTFNNLFTQNLQKPEASFYSFLSLNVFNQNTKIDTTNSVNFCSKLLEQANIAIVPGIAFGKEGYVRFSYGAKPEELIEALNALKKYLSNQGA